MEELMEIYGWKLNEVSLLDIKGTDLILSVYPEYTYWKRDSNGFLSRSKQPTALKLNCALKVPYTAPGTDEVIYDNKLYIEFTSEEEFYDFMISIKKEYSNTKRLLV
jgi:hypothetical protein